MHNRFRAFEHTASRKAARVAMVNLRQNFRTLCFRQVGNFNTAQSTFTQHADNGNNLLSAATPVEGKNNELNGTHGLVAIMDNII